MTRRNSTSIWCSTSLWQRSILDGLCRKCEELLGCEMIYQLVEFTKECLTDNNLPSGECAICLSGFEESDEFQKTDCYHYFHLPCLADYLHYYQRQLLEDQEEDRKVDMMLRKKTRQLECPVCRVSIDTSTLNFDPSKTMATPVKSIAFQPSPKLREWQNKMEALLLKQRRKGGVIDTSQSDVIDGTWVSTVSITSKNDQSTISKSESTEDIKKSEPSLSKTSPKTNRKRNDYSRVKSSTYQRNDRKPKQEQVDGTSKSSLYGRYKREDNKSGAHQSGPKRTRARDPVKSGSSKNNKHESEGATFKIPVSKTVVGEITIMSGGTESISTRITSSSKEDNIHKNESRSKDRSYVSKIGDGRDTRRPRESGGVRGGKPGSRGLETKTTS
ncbi:E3 ubiquitin-protein ligase RNF25-like isoform X3 [Halichondria panicea]|uniref:E3 ubiquitin-protein ligase RNF25-like isoform X3 n=1 Tax=Halichondria panicea TaxID=6063 RepID=UPI00312B9F4C